MLGLAGLWMGRAGWAFSPDLCPRPSRCGAGWWGTDWINRGRWGGLCVCVRARARASSWARMWKDWAFEGRDVWGLGWGVLMLAQACGPYAELWCAGV